MSTRGRGIAFDPAEAAARALGVTPEQLAGPAGVEAARRVVGELDAPGIAALQALVDLGGVAPSLQAVDEIADALSGETARRDAEQALLALWERGLVARDRSSRTFFLVPDLGAALVPALRERLLESLEVVPAPPPAIDEHLLACAINVLRHEPLKLTREAMPFKRSVETLVDKLKAALPRKDAAAHVDLVIATLVDLGMLERRADTLEVSLAAVEEWAHGGQARREARVLDSDITGVASFLLAQLRDLGPDRAWPVDTLVRFARRLVLTVDGMTLVTDLDREIKASLATLERAGLAARAPSG